MLTNIEIFFMMFYYNRRVNKLYIDSNKHKIYSSEFYQRLFGSQPTAIQKNFMQNCDQIIGNSKF